MIEVEVKQVLIYNNELLVLLRGDADARFLPVQVDPGQAHAIELHLEGKSFPRPLTHDLLKTVISDLGAKFLRAEISDLTEGTFHARLIISKKDKELVIDARPSDAIALAIRCSAPIYVDEEVMNKAGVIIQAEQQAAWMRSGEKKKLTAEEMVRQKLKKAIADERYEDAAELRDELKQLQEKKPNN